MLHELDALESRHIADLARDARKVRDGLLEKVPDPEFGEAEPARGEWHVTAFYSNTARAHQLGHTSDRVVSYFHRDARPEGRRTIVTETQGPARGHRVVRGREPESTHADAAA